MAELDPLIRVRRYALEQKQKFLAELYTQQETLTTQRRTILDQLEAERQKLDDMPVEMRGYFTPYANSVTERAEEMQEQIDALEGRIDIAREEIRLAFAELKKIEITQENREKAEQEALDKKESDTLDEIAINRYLKNQREDDKG